MKKPIRATQTVRIYLVETSRGTHWSANVAGTALCYGLGVSGPASATAAVALATALDVVRYRGAGKTTRVEVSWENDATVEGRWADLRVMVGSQDPNLDRLAWRDQVAA
jgi:hypothetical protein